VEHDERLARVRQYLRAGLVDEIHLAIAPVLLGSGDTFSSVSTQPGSATR
jgi:dihydrofolate reductase